MVGTNWTNMTNFESILSEANRYAPFWTGMMFMLWIVFIISLLPLGTTPALIGGSFLAMILGILLVYMGLVSLKYVLIIIAVVLVIIIYEAIFVKKG